MVGSGNKIWTVSTKKAIVLQTIDMSQKKMLISGMNLRNKRPSTYWHNIWNTTVPGWVVTWFLLGYSVRMFEYTVRTFWSNVGRFLYVFSSIPRKLCTIFQPTFSPIKRYQDSIFKLLTLSTNSVTNVVRTAYFQMQARSSPLTILWQSLYSK